MGWGWSWMVECLPSLHEALDSILRTENTKHHFLMCLVSLRCQHPLIDIGLVLLGDVWVAPSSGLTALCLDATAYQNLLFVSGLCPGLPWPSGAWDCLSVWEKRWNSFSGWFACVWEWWCVGIACISLSVKRSKQGGQWVWLISPFTSS